MNDIKTRRAKFDERGNKIWKNEKGELHREDGPAYIMSSGERYWCKNGLLHREDGPAVVQPNGHKEWLINGKWHREDGPAIEHANGNKSWYINDQRYREDGPAVVSNCMKAWYDRGVLLRREDAYVSPFTGKFV